MDCINCGHKIVFIKPDNKWFHKVGSIPSGYCMAKNCKCSLPMSKGSEKRKIEYDIIYADPPWKYDFAREIKDRPNKMQIVETHYPTMELEKIKNMNIPSKKDCVLFLWCPSPKLKEGLEVLEAWGFSYITSLVWDKMIKGMGYWTRSQHEFILIGRKGKVSPPRLQVSSIIKTKKFGHSRKPPLLYVLIDKMFPNASKIELFARERRENWTAWGNEVPKETQMSLFPQQAKECEKK